jgi:predicted Rossmann fold flavoprotein
LNKIAIVGAGASSLIASIILAKKGLDVYVFEKNTKAGRKILATGNGRCNISNTNLSDEYFFSSNTSFYQYAISQFGFKKFESFCENIGLNLTINENNKVYPMSLQAASVVDVFYNEALEQGVKFHFDSEVTSINHNKKFVLEVNNKKHTFDKVIIATGSSAMKKLGSSDSGYRFAKNFGHRIINPFASLVQLESDDKSIFKLSGVKQHSHVELFVDKIMTKFQNGDILFTNYGVSGNTILDLSREATTALLEKKDVYISIDLFPNIEKNKLLSILEKKKKILAQKSKEFLLMSFVNKKLIGFLFQRANIDKNKTFVHQLNKKDLMQIVYHLKSLKVPISGSRGFDNAEVVAGGVDTKEVDNKTMESKLQKGLYFCGEVLDVDGSCGGYNLHWAWASAYILANNIG